MLDYDGINIWEGIDTNETSGLREYIICHYWYFLKVNFSFLIKLCDGCHDMTQKSMRFIDLAIVTVRRNNYRINFWFKNKCR